MNKQNENKQKDRDGTDITPLTRRELLQQCGSCGGALVLLPMLSGTALGQTGGAGSTKGWIAAGKVARFPVNTPVKVTLSDKRVVHILQEKGGRWKALSARCTHDGCLVGWRTDAGQYVCPCHGATFAKDGSKPTGPARRPLEAYSVRVQSGQVWIAGGTPSSGTGGKKSPQKGHDEEHEEHEREEHRSGRHHDDDDDD